MNCFKYQIIYTSNTYISTYIYVYIYIYKYIYTSINNALVFVYIYTYTSKCICGFNSTIGYNRFWVGITGYYNWLV